MRTEMNKGTGHGIVVDYDERSKVLYITFDNKNSFGEEIIPNVIIRRAMTESYTSDKPNHITGITIYDCKLGSKKLKGLEVENESKKR